ncbi:DUF6415 family natural product biosynthesis protein [Streptomyces sp. LE64]|uniref:DUF6415 family natural product biosynthesis protein n=1 Tax=Streptomyces sp. LE64 TaxID=3448653 RepID=UPI00404318B2
MVHDDLERAVGAVPPPGPEEVDRLTGRLRRSLAQLVRVLLKRRGGRPCTVESAAVARARRALAEPAPYENARRHPDAALGHLRRVDLVTLDLLDALDEAPHGSPPPHPRGNP